MNLGVPLKGSKRVLYIKSHIFANKKTYFSEYLRPERSPAARRCACTIYSPFQKFFTDDISRLSIPCKSYESETLHRVLSQSVLIGKYILFAGNRPLNIFPMASIAKLLDTYRG